MELQTAISQWGDEAFGPVRDPIALVDRARLELTELADAVSAGEGAEIGGEIADVVIILYRLADQFGLDLDAEVLRKLEINRARRWSAAGDGTGRHLAE